MRMFQHFAMKKIFTLFLILVAFSAGAQQYNNEWIRHSQTYYKFKVGSAGLYRIPKSVLDAAGIGNTQVQFFELWRNGEQVPFYPSVNAGVLPANGYIEFYGIPNDGKPDRPMYRDTAYQHTTVNSLISDTAVYFLSVNTNQSGFMIFDGSNDVASNTLPVEPYFMHTAGNYFKLKQNLGIAAVVVEYVYSSSYDKGEYWSSNNIFPGGGLTTSLNNLHVYASGPATSRLSFGASGLALNPRNIQVSLNNTLIKDTVMDYFNDVHTTIDIPTSSIASNSASVKFVNTSTVGSDRYVVSYYDLTYPRTFDFDGASNFEFRLPADNDGYYLEITNFNAGSAAPVLYDLTFGTRYVADMNGGTARFVLPASTSESRYVMVSEDPSNVRTVNSLTQRNFVNYKTVANQGNYLMISHPLLNVGTSGRKPLDEYLAYRSSPDGGSFNTRFIDVDDLVDQFAFGIRKHPLSVRNFIRFARANFQQPLKYIFLVGRGMAYNEFRANQNDPQIDQLNLIPTFGTPASDNLLSAQDISNPVPTTPIGRLSVVRGSEIEDYLEKLKEYEYVQKTAPNTLAGRDWMKNVIHVTGASDPYLGVVLCNYMSVYKQMIEDTLFGGKVSTFCKTSTNPVEQLTTDHIKDLFEEGVSILTYFGHSSATTLEFNLDNPQSYNNPGKYPVFFVNGCNAGNFFTYYPQRFLVNETLSEKYVLAKQRGSVAFMASTHFGIVNYLNIYLNNLYNVIGKKDYAHSLGEINQMSLQALIDATGPFDFYARMHAEEITLHGDPALKLNVQPKPDYVIEEKLIKVNPAFISIAEDSFLLSVKVVNLGKAVSDSVTLQIRRTFPDGTSKIIYTTKLPGIRYSDSIALNIPIVATRDKGTNKITATIDSDSRIDEMAEDNNTATKELFIYEDEARPIYPYAYSIVNTQGQKVYASTANAFAGTKNYVMEMDTTQNFNSPLKVTKTLSTVGGVMEFVPGINYADSVVYYWRVSLVPPAGGDYRWNNSSFVYIPGTETGFNQSHFFQHLESDGLRISMDPASRKWKYGNNTNSLFIHNTVYPTGSDQQSAFVITVNDQTIIGPGCNYNELIFNVFDPLTFKPWKNDFSGPTGLYNSLRATCGSQREYNFQYLFSDSASRKKAMDFMDAIPDGAYVVVRANASPTVGGSVFVNKWKDDTTRYGTNNSLYHRLLYAGFTDLDNYNKPRTFSFLYRKGDPTFTPISQLSDSIFDKITLPAICYTPDTLGYITSPKFGPAKQWKKLQWGGTSEENPTDDRPVIDVIGVDQSGIETVLFQVDQGNHDFDISLIPASTYPFLKLRMMNLDSTKLTPYQLKYWRIYYDGSPEGTLAPNIQYSCKDTFEIGEPLKFSVAFKNISPLPFDSVAAKLMIIDNNNQQRLIQLPKQKPVQAGDTLTLRFELDTKDFPMNNIMYVDLNPDNDQPEQYHFNNFLYKNFYVRPDKTNPLLDVTFDGVHILNRDLVSAKPHIMIKLKDDAKFLLLNDTALSTVQIRYPDGSLRNYHFDNDTLRFIPATNGSDNTASIDFYPQFLQQFSPDGDEYELIVKGKDRSGNKAGQIEYRVTFKVISKPMISNLLNYPNPFSTSTAFVFTITGSELPQNMKIQILTVTGKIVREITMNELGPIHIGRNITDYKWDGTDQYGQKLANGVYLYRVVTTLNGKQMDKYKAEGDNTDKYFNNGYGKMYLMR